MTTIVRTMPKNIIPAVETMQEKTPLSSASGLLLCVLNVSLSYTAIMSNILTIHAVRKTSKNLKTLLLSQAISDIGVGSVVQPLYVARMILYWSQGTENNPTYFAIMIMHIIASNLFSFATIHGAIYGVVYRQIHGRSSSPQIPGTCDTQASCWCGNLNLGIERISFIRQAVDVNKFHVRNSRDRYIHLYCNGNFL